MSPDGSMLELQAAAGWQSIRPWTPPLSLAVREIASVSVTFILSSSVSDSGEDLDSSLASLGLSAADYETEDQNRDENEIQGETRTHRDQSIISHALAKGLSVNVNGSPWQRVFIKIDDKVDEAVIIIYGLMPGRHYDIDLGIVQGGQALKRQVTTEESEDASEIHTDPDSPSFGRSTSSEPPISTPSTSPSHSSPVTPPSDPKITLEDRLHQLQHNLSLVNAERESLLASLKAARRDSQKADAALRSEIDILKRASEKHAAAEHRAKQKILALQETVKRVQTASRETEELVKEVESDVPGLIKKKEQKEQEYVKVKEEADNMRSERDKEGEKEKKKMEAMKGELAGLGGKLEKLNGKKERLESNTIPELEEQLRDIESEIEKAEAESQRYLVDMDDLHSVGGEIIQGEPPTYMPIQRTRHHSATTPGPISRPPPLPPIQRPPHSELINSLNHSSHTWNIPPRQSQNIPNNPRPSLIPGLLLNTKRRSSTSVKSSPPANTSSPTSSSPTQQHAALGVSTLSSRAQAFEPGKPIKAGTIPQFSASIQRPANNLSRARSSSTKTNPHVQWNIHGQYENRGN